LSVEGHEKIVELLVSKGADTNAQNRHYGNALQAASVRGHDKIVELLVSKGAIINAQGGHYGIAL
jgi:ankyrin repeat protein